MRQRAIRLHFVSCFAFFLCFKLQITSTEPSLTNQLLISFLSFLPSKARQLATRSRFNGAVRWNWDRFSTRLLQKRKKKRKAIFVMRTSFSWIHFAALNDSPKLCVPCERLRHTRIVMVWNSCLGKITDNLVEIKRRARLFETEIVTKAYWSSDSNSIKRSNKKKTSFAGHKFQ